MLQRAGMYKLRAAAGLTMNSAFTDTQEAKQAIPRIRCIHAFVITQWL